MQPASSEPVACPACDRQLIQITIGTIHLDVCHGGCGGIWFDAFELQTMDNGEEPAGDLLKSVEKDVDVTVDDRQRRGCPRCSGIKLRRHFFGIQQKVMVDSCPSCGGYWLDHGELFEIRRQFRSDADRRIATDQFMEDLDNRHETAADPSRLDKARSVRSLDAMFRVIGSRYC